MAIKPTDGKSTTTGAASVDEGDGGAGIVAELDALIQEAVDGVAPAPAAERIKLLFGDGQTIIPRPGREHWRRKYGFAISSSEVVAAIAALGTPVLTVGSGTGYYDQILRHAGLDVTSTGVNGPLNGYGPTHTWCHIEQSDAAAAIIRYPGRAVFVSWPCHNQDWAARALRELHFGQALIYIGEPAEGCNADADFFRILDSEFEIAARPTMASFPCIHDGCLIYRRL